jgi:hypothetical protein
MDNADTSDVLLEIEDLSHSTNVVSSSDVGEMSRLVLGPFGDLSLFEVVLNSVSLVDFRMGESDGSGVTSHDVGDLVGANSFLCDLQQFVFGLSIFYLDKGESSLNVI